MHGGILFQLLPVGVEPSHHQMISDRAAVQIIFQQLTQDLSRNIIYISATGRDQYIRHLFCHRITPGSITELLSYRHIGCPEILRDCVTVQFPVFFRGSEQIIIDHPIHRIGMLLHIVQQKGPAEPAQSLQISIRHPVTVYEKYLFRISRQSLQYRKFSLQIFGIRPQHFHRHMVTPQQFCGSLIRTQKAHLLRMFC